VGERLNPIDRSSCAWVFVAVDERGTKQKIHETVDLFIERANSNCWTTRADLTIKRKDQQMQEDLSLNINKHKSDRKTRALTHLVN
jgi:hypothetical protein